MTLIEALALGKSERESHKDKDFLIRREGSDSNVLVQNGHLYLASESGFYDDYEMRPYCMHVEDLEASDWQVLVEIWVTKKRKVK